MKPSKKLHHKQKSGLFHQLSFILVTDVLSRKDIENISIQILQHQGTLQTIDCSAVEDLRAVKVDYLLCDPRLDGQQIRAILPASITFKDILDVSYIQACISAKKILPIGSYRLKTNNSKQFSSEPKKRTKIQQTQQQQLTQKPQKKQQEKKKKDITKPSNNQFIIDQLNKLLKVYSNEGDKGRKIAYSRAIGTLKTLDKQLESQQDVQNLRTTQKHIGPKIIDKIKQLLKTGSIGKLQKIQNTQQNIALQQITRVWGIGAVKAKQLYERGIRTIEDLNNQVKKHPDILTKNQKIGLKYIQDLQIRIPRKKVTLMFQVVRDTLYQIVGRKDLHQIEVCGSYRRGKQTCGDMDIFITRKDGQYQKNLLTKLVDKLAQKEFLTDHLGMPRNNQNKGCQTYMGICHFKDQLHHRIDIKYYPIQQFAYAVLYFTGSDMFNRKMRLQAIEKGYHLSDHGMFKFSKHQDKSQSKGPPIICKTEKQIFQILGIQYKDPKDRDI